MKAIFLSWTLITAYPLVAMDINPLSHENTTALPANIERAIAPFESQMQLIEQHMSDLNTHLLEAYANSDQLDPEMEKIANFINAYQTRGFNQCETISLNSAPNYSILKNFWFVSQITNTFKSRDIRDALSQAYNIMLSPENQQYGRVSAVKEWSEKHMQPFLTEISNSERTTQQSQAQPRTARLTADEISQKIREIFPFNPKNYVSLHFRPVDAHISATIGTNETIGSLKEKIANALGKQSDQITLFTVPKLNEGDLILNNKGIDRIVVFMQ